MNLPFARIESTSRALVFSMSFSLLAKIFSLMQSLVITYAFGVQKSTDILFFVLSFVLLLVSLASCINQQVLVPMTIFVRKSHSENDAKKLISYIFLVYMIIGSLGTALLCWSPVKILSVFSKFSADDLQKNMDIVVYIVPVFFILMVNTFILDILTSYRYFTIPMVLDMLKNICIIVFVVLFKESMAVKSLALGVLLGNLLQLIVLCLLLFFVLGCRITFQRFKIGHLASKNILFVVLGQIVTFVNGWIVMYLMSGFYTGVYSAMDYSQRIYTIFITVVIGQISTVVGISILELYSKEEFDKLRTLFMKYLQGSLFLVFPVCFILSINAESLITLLFERGKFTHEATLITSEFFKYFILIAPFRLMDAFVARLIIAKQIQKVAFLWQVFSNTIQILGIWLMVSFLGYKGYPLGLLMFYGAYALLFVYFGIRRQFSFIDAAKVTKLFVYNLVLNGLILLGFLFLRNWLQSLNIFVALGASTLIYLAVYLFLGDVTHVNRDVMASLAIFRRGRKAEV